MTKEDPIPEITIDSWKEFDEIVRSRSHRRWIYRGHANSKWELESSIFRDFEKVVEISKMGNKKAKKINRNGHEKIALKRFINNAHLYLDHWPEKNEPLEWLAQMQHFGAPTRLLDFTFSPYVALYFALEKGTSDAAVYCLKHEMLKEIDEEYYEGEIEIEKLYRNLLSEKKEQFIFAYEPRFSNERLMAQQGIFLIPSSNEFSHEEIISDYSLSNSDFVKFIIPKEIRKEGLEMLTKTNITPTLLFPGLDGFCRSFRYQSLSPLFSQSRIGEY